MVDSEVGAGPSIGRAQVDKVLVTGANGFIGRWLCAHLAELGVPTRVVVRSQVGEIPTVTEIVFAEAIDAAATYSGISHVVHLAARAHRHDARDPGSLDLYRRENAELALSVGTAAARAGVGHLVFLSTIGVLGEQTGSRPFDELSTPNPRSSYAQSKQEAEQQLQEIAATSEMAVTIVRPTLVYGNPLVGNLARLAQAVGRGLPLPLAGLTNRRTILSVRSLVDLIGRVLRRPTTGSTILVAGDKHAVSTTEIVSAIARGMGVEPILFRMPRSVVRLLSRTRWDAIGRQLYADLEVDSELASRRYGWGRCDSTLDELATCTRQWRLACARS